MLGLINKSVQCFLRETYGAPLWARVAARAGLGRDCFEPLLHYDDAITEGIIAAALAELGKTREVLLEDLGTFLASREVLRRLLRFGGGDYLDFLLSLEELRGRGRLTLPDLDLPGLVLRDTGGGHFMLMLDTQTQDWTPVFAGLLRAMADDYGALVLIETVAEGVAGGGQIAISLMEARYAAGRSFDLAAPPTMRAHTAGGGRA